LGRVDQPLARHDVAGLVRRAAPLGDDLEQPAREGHALGPRIEADRSLSLRPVPDHVREARLAREPALVGLAEEALLDALLEDSDLVARHLRPDAEQQVPDRVVGVVLLDEPELQPTAPKNLKPEAVHGVGAVQTIESDRDDASESEVALHEVEHRVEAVPALAGRRLIDRELVGGHPALSLGELADLPHLLGQGPALLTLLARGHPGPQDHAGAVAERRALRLRVACSPGSPRASHARADPMRASHSASSRNSRAMFARLSLSARDAAVTRRCGRFVSALLVVGAAPGAGASAACASITANVTDAARPPLRRRSTRRRRCTCSGVRSGFIGKIIDTSRLTPPS
jgi:hypothetical protein